MPKEERFVDNFVVHGGHLIAAADALAAMMAASGKDLDMLGDAVCAIEHEADVVNRQTVIALHRAFITPFDRSDILALSNALDDAVDLIKQVVLHTRLYQAVKFDGHTRKFACLIQAAARLLADIMPLLRNISGNAEKIRALCEDVGKIERDADTALREALSEVIALQPDTITFFGRKGLCEILEEVTDSCDAVAQVIEGIVLDHV
jgi:uncharacterized protein Yka (UPF0111/DUF47 family)